MDAFRAKVAEAFARWSEITNITYVEVSDDGAPMPNAPGLLGARGDIRIGMHAIGEGPLAYNFYPLFGGDMVLDSLDMATFADSTGDYRACATCSCTNTGTDWDWPISNRHWAII
jgi:hypothetical protein